MLERRDLKMQTSMLNLLLGSSIALLGEEGFDDLWLSSTASAEHNLGACFCEFLMHRESIAMLKEEGFDNVVARHHRLAEGARRAVEGWGLQVRLAKPGYIADALGLVRLQRRCSCSQDRRERIAGE